VNAQLIRRRRWHFYVEVPLKTPTDGGGEYVAALMHQSLVNLAPQECFDVFWCSLTIPQPRDQIFCGFPKPYFKKHNTEGYKNG
jgi:hypothetical protein